MKKIMGKVAKGNNVSVQEVEQEIRRSIQIGMSNENPAVTNKWKELFGAKEPTVEEFIKTLAEQVKKREK